jgi:hypothetical protein
VLDAVLLGFTGGGVGGGGGGGGGIQTGMQKMKFR